MLSREFLDAMAAIQEMNEDDSHHTLKTDDDGYTVIGTKEPWDIGKPKGIKCGLCDAKFDHGSTICYSCSRTECPIFPHATC